MAKKAKKKEYMALFVKEVEKYSEPIFLTSSPTVKITAKPIFTSNGKNEFSSIVGQTKEEIDQKIKKLKAESNLFWGIGARKLPKDAEIIVVSL